MQRYKYAHAFFRPIYAIQIYRRRYRRLFRFLFTEFRFNYFFIS